MTDIVTVASPASGQTRATFTSAEVGNGSANDSNTLANQDGGLAVRLQAEDDADGLTGPVTRTTDEDIVFVAEGAGTFDVRDLVSGVRRGDQFGVVQLGTQAGDTLTPYDAARATYINAGQGDDTVSGGAVDDFLVGGAGDDTLDGGEGSDSFIGGGGDDTVTGGAGGDTAIVNLSTDGADAIDLGEGADQVNLSTAAAGQVRLTFTSAEVGNGSANDSGTLANQDGGLAVRIQTEDGADGLTGPVTRSDDEGTTFVAGPGTTFDVRDLVSGVERGDQFRTASLGTNAGDNLIGTGEADYVNAGQGDDTVLGLIGNDFLVGGAGNDTLDGGADDDSFIGGAGDDIIEGSIGNDTAIVNLSTDGADTIDLGDGSDRVNVSTAAAGQVRLSFTSAEVGNGSALDGGTLANQDGGLAVRVQAEDGSDGLTGPVTRTDDEGITFVAGAGTTFDVRDLVSGVERGDLFRTASLGTSAGERLTGTDEADYINAGQGDDTLRGGAGDDFLVGGAGIDVLEGGSGDDGLLGGGGDDSYAVTESGDRVFEQVGGGNDTVVSAISYKLQAGQEVETLQLARSTGSADLKLEGNEFDNTLRGNAGINLLNGNAGDDQLYGGAGGDSYVVDNAGDRVFEVSGQGNDKVIATISYRLQAGQEIETLQLSSGTGTADLKLVGNEFDNTLRGNDGDNLLDGSTGADQLYGSAGDDSYVVDNAGDRVFEFSGQGNDKVITTISYRLQAGQEVETLQLSSGTGAADLKLSGNELDNILRGNDGDNALIGGGGADVLFGSRGNDLFVFDTALGAGNVDRLADFSAGNDRIRLEASVFSGLESGVLDADAFKEVSASGASVDADDRILYDRGSGALSFDADGSGSGAAVQFAVVDTRDNLTFQDFVVV